MQDSQQDIEEADSILTGKKKNAEKHHLESNCNFSYFDLWNDGKTSSIWNLLDLENSLPANVDPSEVLKKREDEKPNPRIWVAIDDLNNSKTEPNVNKSKNALEIGIEFDF